MAIKRQTKHKLSRGTGIVFCALIYAILFLPIVIVVANSFNGNTEKPYLSWDGFSLRWYVHLFQNGPLLASFGNTMLLAITTTVLATALGTLGAVGLYRYKFPGRNLIDSLLYIPVVIPEIVMGISLLLVYVKVGVPRGMVGLIIAHVTFCVSFVIFNVRARLDGYDPSLEEASMDLGANRLVTFFKVTLPMLAPGIAGSAALLYALDRRRRGVLLCLRPGPDLPAQGDAIHQGRRGTRCERAVHADLVGNGACRRDNSKRADRQVA